MIAASSPEAVAAHEAGVGMDDDGEEDEGESWYDTRGAPSPCSPSLRSHRPSPQPRAHPRRVERVALSRARYDEDDEEFGEEGEEGDVEHHFGPFFPGPGGQFVNPFSPGQVPGANWQPMMAIHQAAAQAAAQQMAINFGHGDGL